MTDDWKIPLTGKLGEGKFTLVDEDTYLLYGHLRWHLSDSGYAMRRGKYGASEVHTVRLHRLIMNCSEDMVVDHRNGDKLDNRKENLWVVSRGINNSNREVRGYYVTRSGGYAVSLRGEHIGTYYSEEEAREAYKKARDKLNLPTRFKESV